MTQKIIFFTGGTSGIGREAIRSLLSTSNKVYLIARPSSRLDDLVAEAERLPGKLIPLIADLNDLLQVKTACKKFLEDETQLDVLVNNAGIWENDFKKSENNFELTLQINLLVPKLLIEHLKPALLSSRQGKIINTASALHQGKVNFQDLEYSNKFSGFNAYRQSKLGLILMTRYLAKIEPDLGVYSFHPGVVSTDLGRNLGWLGRIFFNNFGTSPAKGADTLLYLIHTDRNELISGSYYFKRKPKQTTPTSNDLQIAQVLMKQLDVLLEK